jgi:Uncharacterized conserved protein
MFYGALQYKNSCNLGDNIQTLAALQYLPRVDFWVDRDTGETSAKQPITVIYNGWFNEHFWYTIPKNIIPIFIAFHLDTDSHENQNEYKWLQKFRIKRNTENFKVMKSVGCRDLSTLEYLRQNKINAYFSGCISLTLKPPKVKKTNSILVVDVDCSVPWIQSLPNKKIRSQVTKSVSNDMKLEEAKKLLEDIASSKLVITSRLHTMLPSVAFNVPVIFVTKNKNDKRFSGLIDYVPISDGTSCPVEDLENFTWDKMHKVKHLKALGDSLKIILPTII